jgi:uncharacterized membrane protein
MKKVKTRLLTGLLVIAPAFVSVFIIYYIFDKINLLLSPIIIKLLENFLGGVKIPSFLVGFLSIILLALTILTIGFLAENFIGNKILGWFDGLMSRTPIIRGVYSAVKQFLEAFKITSTDKFETVVALEYPKDDMWVIGFVTSSVRSQLSTQFAGNLEMINVFIPTTPNPTSGYLVMVEKSKVKQLDMPIELAVKYVVSAGILQQNNGKIT